MRDWIIPVALSALLGSGAGQLYNKDYKKAGILITVGVILVGWMTVSTYKMVMPYLTQDVANMDIVQLAETGEKIRTQLATVGTGSLLGINLLLMGIWIYGIVDAYQGAKKRALLKPALTPT